MAAVFFSYSHKDESLRDKLEVHLAILKRQGDIETWHDRRIIAGDEFAGKIAKELEIADIILALVSSDFLNSNYCYDVEMHRALQRHEANEARVIPIILRQCDWLSSPLGKLKALPRDGKPIVSWPDLDEALHDVVKGIRESLPPAPKVETRSSATTLNASQQILTAPRSSNLRIRKQFTDLEKDEFLQDGFAYIAKFFEGSLAELKIRHPHVEFMFRRHDNDRFSAQIYKDGSTASRCWIRVGRAMERGILYSRDDHGNTYSEQLSVESDDQVLYFKPLGYASIGRTQEKRLTFEGAAEYFWSILLEPLRS